MTRVLAVMLIASFTPSPQPVSGPFCDIAPRPHDPRVKDFRNIVIPLEPDHRSIS